MFLINFVNILQISAVTVALFGIFLLFPYRQYRRICLLLLLVTISSTFNILEEVLNTRDVYLVTPIFLLGFGPAIFIAIKALVGKNTSLYDYIHFLPMFIALPLTKYPEVVIALGTLSRISYALFSLNLLIKFHQSVIQERSDAIELSLTWLGWLLILSAIFNAMNLIRLNLQPYIEVSLNIFGQGVSTLVGILFFVILIRQLLFQKEALLLINTCKSESIADPVNQKPKTKDLEDNSHFIQIFNSLSNEISANKWYRQPRLTLNQLSSLSGFQVRDISRAINLSTGQNFNDYINTLRIIDIGHSIITRTDENILDLALEVGFNSKSSFNKTFKNHFGITPKAYQKREVSDLSIK